MLSSQFCISFVTFALFVSSCVDSFSVITLAYIAVFQDFLKINFDNVILSKYFSAVYLYYVVLSSFLRYQMTECKKIVMTLCFVNGLKEVFGVGVFDHVKNLFSYMTAYIAYNSRM